ncbi:branched-chain amino acid ABC transporter permease [Pyrobaculum ferrireducens]|uniref:Branched-chain amino acid transport permease protein n=1 Tax=Pyrobaculum ferrireducens TaxID=1104324 RepID=G7VGA0_9CREN|nr:branched-chain amino acid ABC transporter permease [Pyrobaculum ferrireducens]AET31811.1 branched-chain amino acid transport permease protein [Pyrobaculum ferrireducens]
MRPYVGLVAYLASAALVWATGRDAASYLLTTVVDISVYLLITLSLNLEAGIAGIPNFGRVLTVAFGAYIAGGVVGRAALWIAGLNYDYVADNPSAVSALARGLSQPQAALLLLMGLAASALVGAALGALTSLPARRLSADYLAITLLAFGDVAYYVGLNYEPLVGGTLGVATPPIYERLFGGGAARAIGAALVSAAVAAAAYVLLLRLDRSPFGRILRIHREDPELVSVLGRDPAVLRAWTMAIGGAVSAVAGLLYALYVGAVHPRGFERITFTFYPWLIMVMGGMGNSRGVVEGVFIFIVIYRLLDIYKYEVGAVVGFDPVWLGYILFGAMAMVIILTMPRGIRPEEVKPLAAGLATARREGQGS